MQVLRKQTETSVVRSTSIELVYSKSQFRFHGGYLKSRFLVQVLVGRGEVLFGQLVVGRYQMMFKIIPDTSMIISGVTVSS